MESVETGKDKVKKICEILRRDTLEPAMQEAESIIADARKKAEGILKEAKEKAEKRRSDAEEEIKKKQEIFETSLSQGSRQTLQWLKQEIEQRLINETLQELIIKETTKPQVLSKLISALVKAIQEEGLETDLSAIIPTVVDVEDVNKLLGKEIIAKLKEKSVILGSLKGGTEIKWHKEKVTIDISDSALFELIKRYIRKDFLKFFFVSNS